MPFTIESVHARQILDSRGHPTVEAEVALVGGALGRAAVPSGASTGEHEAVELRDGDPAVFGGKGVSKAIGHVNTEITDAVLGLDARDQIELDRTMIAIDGTPNKARLGANAILSVSMATAHAAADAVGLPLWRYLGGSGARVIPAPMFNILNGGKHADNTVDFQEFMIQPIGFETYAEALRAAVETYHALKGVLKDDGLSTAVGDEGGFAPDLKSNEDAIRMIERAVDKAGYRWGEQIVLALDPAASELWNAAAALGKEGYCLFKSSKEVLSSDDMIGLWAEWREKHPIFTLEDGLGENDWAGWKKLTERLGGSTQLVGDDIFVTNPAFIRRGLEERTANAALIKPNQIGTLTETFEAVDLAMRHGWGAVFSHRSGETEDATIADVAVATNSGQLKTGAPCRGERTAKYNQLLRIAEELGDGAIFGGAVVARARGFAAG